MCVHDCVLRVPACISIQQIDGVLDPTFVTRDFGIDSRCAMINVTKCHQYNIPDDIRTINEIDSAIGALTSHIKTVVKKCEREVPTSSDRRKFPPDNLELIRAKNAALRRDY
ncbi:hypothetical protein EVAR_4589_1 [Eumeta japonica]|uniref:Uncharacterized protein n=1 Tax=Eumeta variegata TaxID=151549 RepID=A0A4C1SWZ5_EUMVA|nr:hypothetical protein EVAR_4589_1 [Eumeta japonica]